MNKGWLKSGAENKRSPSQPAPAELKHVSSLITVALVLLPRPLLLDIHHAESRPTRADANTGSGPGSGIARVSRKETCRLRTPFGTI